jgi:hypothetical protein
MLQKEKAYRIVIGTCFMSQNEKAYRIVVGTCSMAPPVVARPVSGLPAPRELLRDPVDMISPELNKKKRANYSIVP